MRKQTPFYHWDLFAPGPRSKRGSKATYLTILWVTLLSLNLLTALPTQAATSLEDPGEATQFQTFFEKPNVVEAGNYRTLLNASLDSVGALRLAGEGFAPPRWSGDWADFGLFSAAPRRFNEPFNTVKATWTASVPPSTRVELDVRVSPDNQNWTLWQILETSGQTANFGTDYAFLYAQYRVRLFSSVAGQSPTFSDVRLEVNRRDLQRLNTHLLFGLETQAASSAAAPPTYNVHATREGLVGWRTANGHIIQPRDRFVSLPSWTSLNDKGKSDYKVRIVTPEGRSAIAPVWDVGPWNFKDNYWHNPRFQFKDLPVGVPQAEKAFYDDHNGGKNESGREIGNPSGIDIADGTYWDDLGLRGAQDGRVDVTFMWEGAVPPPATVSNVVAFGPWNNGIQLKWNTSYATSGWVEYGLSDKYGQTSRLDNRMITAHSAVLVDLVPGQTYNFRVRGKDIYGTETVSANATFSTTPGYTLPLATYQGDRGIGVTLLAGDNKNLRLLGGRVNNTLWNDNPKEDYLASGSTAPGALAAIGNLDFDLAPVCDPKDTTGANCTMGYGTGYKNFVRFTNGAGHTFEVGLIHDDAGLSPGSVTLMIEGNLGPTQVRLYNPPNSSDQKTPHHFHFFWQNNKLLVSFDHGKPQSFDFGTDGLRVSFVGAGRARGDIVAAHFQNIAFSYDALTEPPK